MDAAVVLKDEDAGLLHEQGGLLAQEEVGLEEVAAFGQLLLSAVKVKLDAKAVDELDDGVGVVAVLHGADEVLEEPSGIEAGVVGSPGVVGLLGHTTLHEQDGGGQISEQMRCDGGDGLEVAFGEEQLDHGLQSLRSAGVPLDEEGPVHQPRSLLERFERRELVGCRQTFDGIFARREGHRGSLPVLHEDLARQSAPKNLKEVGIDLGQVVHGLIPDGLVGLVLLLGRTAVVDVVLVIVGLRLGRAGVEGEVVLQHIPGGLIIATVVVELGQLAVGFDGLGGNALGLRQRLDVPLTGGNELVL